MLALTAVLCLDAVAAPKSVTLDSLIKRLAPTGQPMEAGRSVGSLLVCAQKPDTSKEFLDSLALASHAEWVDVKGVRVLTRGAGLLRATENYRAEQAIMIDRAISKLGPETRGPMSELEVRECVEGWKRAQTSLSSNPNSFELIARISKQIKFPLSRLAPEIVSKIGAGRLALVEPGRRVLFSTIRENWAEALPGGNSTLQTYLQDSLALRAAAKKSQIQTNGEARSAIIAGFDFLEADEPAVDLTCGVQRRVGIVGDQLQFTLYATDRKGTVIDMAAVGLQLEGRDSLVFDEASLARRVTLSESVHRAVLSARGHTTSPSVSHLTPDREPLDDFVTEVFDKVAKELDLELICVAPDLAYGLAMSLPATRTFRIADIARALQLQPWVELIKHDRYLLVRPRSPALADQTNVERRSLVNFALKAAQSGGTLPEVAELCLRNEGLTEDHPILCSIPKNGAAMNVGFGPGPDWLRLIFSNGRPPSPQEFDEIAYQQLTPGEQRFAELASLNSGGEARSTHHRLDVVEPGIAVSKLKSQTWLRFERNKRTTLEFESIDGTDRLQLPFADVKALLFASDAVVGAEVSTSWRTALHASVFRSVAIAETSNRSVRISFSRDHSIRKVVASQVVGNRVKKYSGLPKNILRELGLASD